MSPWQMAKQIQYVLEKLTWPDGTNELVLGGGVVITAGMPEEEITRLRSPFVMLNVHGGTVHEELADLIPDQTFQLTIVCHSQDSQGELTLMGGNRTGGQGSSRGRGLLEVETTVIAEVEKVLGIGGVTVRLAAYYDAVAGIVDSAYFASRSYSLQGACTRFLYYHAPRNLSLSGTTLSWELPPDRYDRYQIIVRESATSTPPTGPTDGTGVTLADPESDTSVDVGAGSGRSWAIFCSYDETNATKSEDQRYSAQEIGTTEVE